MRDIAPGAASSSPTSLVDVGGAIYFTASDGTSGSELWRSDGTAAGTVLVKDIRPGTLGSSIALLTGSGGLAYFTANDGLGSELWRSDGTTGGTLRLDPAPPSISELADVNGVLFSAASNALWKSDGTLAGTVQVANASSPRGLTNWAGILYFFAEGTETGVDRDLFRSDGTVAGTVLVRDIDSGNQDPNMRVANGSLFFRARGGSGASYELWKSDGTSAGTLQVADIWPGSGDSSPGPATAVNGIVLFSAQDGVHGVELWRSDGTAGGTALVKDIEPPAALGSYPGLFTTSGAKLFFTATDPDAGTEPWVSDGTGAGTTRLEMRPGSASSFPIAFTPLAGGDVLFGANDGTGSKLWRTDGTPAGTVAIGPTMAEWPRPIVVEGTCYFASTNSFDPNLWKTDGTAAGTVCVHGVDLGGDTSRFAAIGETVLFAGEDPSLGGGWELWKSDGTAAGTVRVKDILPGAGSSTPSGLVSWDGFVYFGANDGTHGLELWRSDGTEAGTVMVKDIRPGSPGGLSADGLFFSPLERIAYDGALYFSATDGSGFEVWKTDGTEAGTQLLRDITTVGPNPIVGGFTVAKGTLFFLVVEQPNTFSPIVSLWKTNGKESGTLEVDESLPPPTLFGGIWEIGDELFFEACEPGAGCEAWTSDGTAPGTLRAADVWPGPRHGLDVFDPAVFTRVGSRILFPAQGPTTGIELWSLPLDAVPDADGDGLYDVSETALGTQLDDSDSDDDGLSDAEEAVRHNTSPLVADSDGDGFGDGEEVAAGSDPLDAGSTPPEPVPALPAWGIGLLAAALAASGFARLRRGSPPR